MEKGKYLVLTAAAVLALSLGAFAQQGGAAASPAGSKGDSVTPVTKPAQQQPLNKQTSVMRPTKKTNWSKIKTLFE